MASTYTGIQRKRRASRRSKPAAGTRLLVIGNGMVGCKFLEVLVDRGLHQHFRVTVVGDEPSPAYDRIKLSTYVDHRDSSQLELRPLSWYQEHGIELRRSTRAIRLDRESKQVELSDHSSINYDLLVLATGSRPFVPPIEGRDLPSVFTYRNLADLDQIIEATRGRQKATVIGGGLLGLEAAQAVQKLGLKTAVIERAGFLMPQQLNQTAAELLHATVTAQGIKLHLGVSSTRIERAEDSLQLILDEQVNEPTDIVIISAGITPNSELADQAMLHVGARGGVVVNRHLETEDPAIFAIGECALMSGRIYGLAAPGFMMARHLAARLAGEKTKPLPDLDTSTRLKMLGANVVSIGNPLEEGTRHEHSQDEIYRMVLTNSKSELIGAMGVGPWDESGRVHSLFEENARLRETEIARFKEQGSLIMRGKLSQIAHWPDQRIVCNCMGVTKGTLVGCMAKCGADPDSLAKATSASTVCGSCRPLLEELCGEAPRDTRPIGARALLITSGIALLLVLITIFTPGPAMADSVESVRYKIEQLWRDSLLKQITGFSLLGVFTIGLLLSLRKRIRWFRIGHFARWRVFHALFGVLSLVVLFAHTGFRFGHNLNFWLMLTFVGINLAGAAAGIVSAIESHGTSELALKARRFRPFLVWSHIILFWPLPVLLTFHILSVYLY